MSGQASLADRSRFDLFADIGQPSASGLTIPDVSGLDAHGAAQAYAACGGFVLPILKGTKNPGSRVGKHWHQQSTNDPRTITEMWAGTSDGIALHVGRSGPHGAVVLDVDHPEHLPEILTQALRDQRPPFQQSRPDQLGRGHYVFAVPEGRIIGNGVGGLGGGWGEVRGRNGVIVVAPSVHEEAGSGAAYRWLTTGAVPVLPVEIADLLPDSSEATDAASSAQVSEFIARHTAATRPELVKGWCTSFDRKVENGRSRHDTAVSMLTGALKEAAAGLISAAAADEALRSRFLRAVTDPTQAGARSEHRARDEWSGIQAWAVAQALAADPAATLARTEAKVPAADVLEVSREALAPAGVDPDTGEITSTDGQSPTNLPEEWWRSRPILSQISDAAHARAMSRDAVLGAVLARVSFATPYMYRLPAIVGSAGSLNVMAAVIGPPGSGKSTSKGVAMDLLPVAGPDMLDDIPPGSGEGLIEAYHEMVDEKVEGPDGKSRTVKVKRQTKRAMFAYVDEGEAMTDQANRKGATLFSTLRSAWSGATLGQFNAGTETKRTLPAHSYRCAIVVGFQPTKAAALLNDDAGGTPQRYLWFSAIDRAIPQARPQARDVQPLTWEPPVRITAPHELAVANTIQDRIYSQHVAVQRGEITLDALDTHGNLVHLKTAALLAILDGRLEVAEDDWRLADAVMVTSRAVRASIQAVAQAEAHVAEERSITRQIRRDTATADAAEDRLLDRAARRVANHVHTKTGPGHQCARRCLQQTLGGMVKAAGLQAVLDEAESNRWITPQEDHYLPGEMRPA